MFNERKTEVIVRKHFEKFNNLICIEEQSSENPRINKLLNVASKKGCGKGRPDFLITFSKNPNLLMVIECKADIKKHESKSRDRYIEYAVDGSLLYSSYLSKEYDVL